MHFYHLGSVGELVRKKFWKKIKILQIEYRVSQLSPNLAVLDGVQVSLETGYIHPKSQTRKEKFSGCVYKQCQYNRKDTRTMVIDDCN